MTRSVLVASAAAVIDTTGSMIQPCVKWSDTATVWNPRSSMRRTSARHCSGGTLRRGIDAMNRKGFTASPLRGRVAQEPADARRADLARGMGKPPHRSAHPEGERHDRGVRREAERVERGGDRDRDDLCRDERRAQVLVLLGRGTPQSL